MLESSSCRSFHVHTVSKDINGWTEDLADEVHAILGQTWDSWWDPQSMVNVCMINLNQGDRLRQFLYCSTSHKYCDGGGAAAFVRALVESYECCVRAEQVVCTESPVLKLQQDRLWNYLSGQPCAEGTIDAYFQDINHDTFYHDIGNSVAVHFTDRVCESVRVVGLRVGCSEEIAWLTCITCALCRLMPDEKLIKILMVHNGRIGHAEGSIACVSQYVMLTIPCAGERGNVPLADVASRVKFAVTNGKFTRPAPCEQAHAKINIGGMVGSDGNFSQVFKTQRSRKAGRSRAPHVVQLRMDNEGGMWIVKDFKCHKIFEPQQFWTAVICASQEIAQGWFTNPVSWS